MEDLTSLGETDTNSLYHNLPAFDRYAETWKALKSKAGPSFDNSPRIPLSEPAKGAEPYAKFSLTPPYLDWRNIAQLSLAPKAPSSLVLAA